MGICELQHSKGRHAAFLGFQDFKISKKNIEVPKYVELQAKGSIMAGGEILQHTCHDRPWKS